MWIEDALTNVNASFKEDDPIGSGYICPCFAVLSCSYCFGVRQCDQFTLVWWWVGVNPWNRENWTSKFWAWNALTLVLAVKPSALTCKARCIELTQPFAKAPIRQADANKRWGRCLYPIYSWNIVWRYLALSTFKGQTHCLRRGKRRTKRMQFWEWVGDFV